MADSDESEVLTVAHDLVAAFGSHDADEYFRHFAADATFIFHTHPQILHSREEWENLWLRWERDNDFKVRSCESRDGQVQFAGKDVAIFRHCVTSVIEFDGSVDTVAERETIVFAHRDDRWLAIHEHLSPAESSPAESSD